jgi:hypothetical protein
MGNMVEATVTIKGVRPLFQHKFGPDSLPTERQERTGVAGNDPQEWRKTATVTSNGQLYLEPTYAFATIREGARFVPKRRGSIVNDVVATMQCTDDRLLVDRWMPGFPNGHACDITTIEPPAQDPEAPVYLDVRGVRNPSTKARNIRYRIAASTGWTITFNILWDKTIVSTEQMKSALDNAGKLVGIGNGRAIGMGRFNIVEFTVKDS